MAFASLADELAGAMDSGDGPGSSLADEFGLDDLGLDEVNGLRGESVYCIGISSRCLILVMRARARD
jgi:hypothetical protein